MQTEEQIRALLSAMSVPAHKLDVTKPTVVKWLLDNLRTRNLTHAKYQVTMRALIDLALAKKWCKKSELHDYEEGITDDAMREGLARWREQNEIQASPSRPPRVDPVVAKVFGPALAKPMDLNEEPKKRPVLSVRGQRPRAAI